MNIYEILHKEYLKYKMKPLSLHPHLSVPDHYHADKDNVDVCSQRFVMIDFVDLSREMKETASVTERNEKIVGGKNDTKIIVGYKV